MSPGSSTSSRDLHPVYFMRKLNAWANKLIDVFFYTRVPNATRRRHYYRSSDAWLFHHHRKSKHVAKNQEHGEARSRKQVLAGY